MNAIEAEIVELAAPRKLRFVRKPLGSPASGEILCRTLASAISPGTELAAYTGLPPLRPGKAYPRVQGYCNVAEVLAIGEGVTRAAPGDRVLTFNSHRSHFTASEADVLVVLPAGADPAEMSVAYLFHLGLNPLLRVGACIGSRVVVIGLGALGLASVAMARRAGAHVSAISNQPALAARAMELGAHAVFSRAEAGDREFAADIVVATTNAWEDWNLALAATAMRATIAVLGFPGRGEGPPPFNPLDSRYFYDRQLRIEGVGLSPEGPDSRGFTRYNERDNLAHIVAEIADGGLNAKALISGVYPAREIERAYGDLIAHKGDPTTFVLSWD